MMVQECVNSFSHRERIPPSLRIWYRFLRSTFELCHQEIWDLDLIATGTRLRGAIFGFTKYSGFKCGQSGKSRFTIVPHYGFDVQKQLPGGRSAYPRTMVSKARESSRCET